MPGPVPRRPSALGPRVRGSEPRPCRGQSSGHRPESPMAPRHVQSPGCSPGGRAGVCPLLSAAPIRPASCGLCHLPKTLSSAHSALTQLPWATSSLSLGSHVTRIRQPAGPDTCQMEVLWGSCHGCGGSPRAFPSPTGTNSCPRPGGGGVSPATVLPPGPGGLAVALS